jgi:hypothetical protein
LHASRRLEGLPRCRPQEATAHAPVQSGHWPCIEYSELRAADAGVHWRLASVSKRRNESTECLAGATPSKTCAWRRTRGSAGWQAWLHGQIQVPLSARKTSSKSPTATASPAAATPRPEAAASRPPPWMPPQMETHPGPAPSPFSHSKVQEPLRAPPGDPGSKEGNEGHFL